MKPLTIGTIHEDGTMTTKSWWISETLATQIETMLGETHSTGMLINIAAFSQVCKPYVLQSNTQAE